MLRIVGDDHMEFTQGRPFGFEVECVTADGEPTQGKRCFFFRYKYSMFECNYVIQGYLTLKGLIDEYAIIFLNHNGPYDLVAP